ncbi:TPA: hypothetical protein ACPTZX_005269, partial [Escherichia coli]
PFSETTPISGITICHFMMAGVIKIFYGRWNWRWQMGVSTYQKIWTTPTSTIMNPSQIAVIISTSEQNAILM